MEKNSEIWKTIDGYPNYMVSNLGRVKSLERNVVRIIGGPYKIEEKILKSSKDKYGYLYVNLCKEGKIKKHKVHRLVTQAFLPNHNNLPQVNHKDENKANNMIWVNEDGSIDYNNSNLEWCDNKYNCNYGSRNERMAKAKSISILQFNKKGEFIRIWNSAKDVENEFGFKHSSISNCCKGKRKSAYGYIWGYADEYEKIPFKVFDIEIYEKKVA